MYHVIKSKLETKDSLTLSEMAYKNNRKQVWIKWDQYIPVYLPEFLDEFYIFNSLANYIYHFHFFPGCAKILHAISS